MDCILRPWKLEDAQDLVAILHNKKIVDNLRDGLPDPYTQQDAEMFITAMLASNSDEVYAFAITWGGRAIGGISVSRKENIHHRTAELGYYLAESCWGRGLATSAVSQICSFVFQNTDILRIFAVPFVENAASCRVLEKAGFACEGVLKSNAVKNGVVRDMKLYALLRDGERGGVSAETARRETAIRQWFSMWLTGRDTGLRELFAPDAVYVESWGPEYRGREKVQLWFDEWNTRGRVQRWDIRQFFHEGDQTVVEWTFRCILSDGAVQDFDGLSLVRWDQEGRICFLKEFGCNKDRYDPYKDGPVPAFRGEQAQWF